MGSPRLAGGGELGRVAAARSGSRGVGAQHAARRDPDQPRGIRPAHAHAVVVRRHRDRRLRRHVLLHDPPPQGRGPRRRELPPQHLRRDRVDGHSGGHPRADGDSRDPRAHRDGGHVGSRHDHQGDRPPVEVALRVPGRRGRLLQQPRPGEPGSDLHGRAFARALPARGRQGGGPSGRPEGPDPAHRG